MIKSDFALTSFTYAGCINIEIEPCTLTSCAHVGYVRVEFSWCTNERLSLPMRPQVASVPAMKEGLDLRSHFPYTQVASEGLILISHFPYTQVASDKNDL